MTSAFGPWLKAKRKELGLTQKELAQRVGCSTVMVEKIEAGERRPSEQIAVLLAGLFKVPAGEERAFVSFARGGLQDGAAAYAGATEHGEAPWRALRRPHNLPAQHTPFIGREEVVAEVCGLLRGPSVRLLTLTGPSG
jgi:transcriptional regulator with XRE-family HTH domain